MMRNNLEHDTTFVFIKIVLFLLVKRVNNLKTKNSLGLNDRNVEKKMF